VIRKQKKLPVDILRKETTYINHGTIAPVRRKVN